MGNYNLTKKRYKCQMPGGLPGLGRGLELLDLTDALTASTEDIWR